MTYVPLADRNEIRKAYDKFEDHMTISGRKVKCFIYYQSGGKEGEVTWRPELGIWSYFDPYAEKTRYWCAFGVEEPRLGASLSITCEINMPHEGIDLRIAGVFVRDANGRIYITHSGRVGGGRKGISKSNFWKLYEGDQEIIDISWPNTKKSKAILIGALDDSKLAYRVMEFVNEVRRFKDTKR